MSILRAMVVRCLFSPKPAGIVLHKRHYTFLTHKYTIGDPPCRGVQSFKDQSPPFDVVWMLRECGVNSGFIKKTPAVLSHLSSFRISTEIAENYGSCSLLINVHYRLNEEKGKGSSQRIDERRNINLIGLMQYLNFGRKYEAAAVSVDILQLLSKNWLDKPKW
ncbi:hypothetical protein TNCV_1320201 [Trichonephila clavipes]|nr:hypothetical protein TNCV_1320201 [Trichonephila clavipes]